MADDKRYESTNEQSGGPAAASPPAAGPSIEERRGALRVLVTLGGLVYAGTIAVPAGSFLAAPTSGGGGGNARWFRIGRLADLPEGEPRRWQVVGDERDAFTVTRNQMLGSVWVMRKGDAVQVLSATCPHLGCSVDIAADKKSFACPCHASKFSLAGAAEDGPSPRAMDPLAARVVEGWVEVDFRRYRQGITEREEVSA